jgi:hypothetical protein
MFLFFNKKILHPPPKGTKVWDNNIRTNIISRIIWIL